MEAKKRNRQVEGRHNAPLEFRPKPDPSLVEPVLARAIDVIGDEDAAMRWLGTPVPALDYLTPISLLNTLAGKNAVLAVLTRLEHGVF